MNADTVSQIVNYLINHWPQIAAYSINGLSIAILLQWIKKKFKLDDLQRFSVPIIRFIHLDGPRIVAILFTVFTGVATAASWLADPTNAQYIPERYAFILMAGVYLHRFLVSPAFTRVEAAVTPYLEAVASMKEQKQAQPSAMPVTPFKADLPPSLAPFNGDPTKQG